MWMAAGVGLAIAASSAFANPVVLKPLDEAKKPAMITIPGDLSTDTNGAAPAFFGVSLPNGVGVSGFEGISQYDGAALARNFIPPDTMGAVGATQYMETSSGSYAVFDKATANRLQLASDVAWWAAAGQTGANGDSRVMYNAQAGRWIVMSFAGSVADLQIAVSDTSNALGPWKSTKFTGFAGGTADYPTLAMDNNAVYIGTNDFKVGCNPAAPAANRLCGTTLNVIPIDSISNAGAPSVANMKQFVTPLDYSNLNPTQNRGFTIQGVNSNSEGSTGTVVANFMFLDDHLTYKVNAMRLAGASTW